MVGVGVAVATSAATVMLGIGPASAVPLALQEIDGVQLLNGGGMARVVVDVACTPGEQITTFVQLTQRQPATGTTPPMVSFGGGIATSTCPVGDNDVQVDVSTSPFNSKAFRTGAAVCGVTVATAGGVEQTGQFVEACRIRLRPVST